MDAATALPGRISDRLKSRILSLQEFFWFPIRAFGAFGTLGRYRRDLLSQMYISGTESIPIVLVSSIAIGALITMEVGNQLAMFGAKALVGRATALSVLREMGP